MIILHLLAALTWFLPPDIDKNLVPQVPHLLNPSGHWITFLLMASMQFPDIPQVVFNGNDGLSRAKHITYWKRCLKTFLPSMYTSTDSYRLMLGYFTLAAMDLLDVLQSDTSREEREHWKNWVYSCQTSDGGFRGSSMTDLKDSRSEENRQWDPPSIPATYFALSALLILGDDLERVDRKACLSFLARMQRPEGSFGETLGNKGSIEGGLDTRFGYTAMGIRWLLRGRVEGEVDGVPDVDVDSFVACLRRSETYDGGISELPFHEAHGGYTFCAVAALYFAGRLPSGFRYSGQASGHRLTAPSNPELTIRWLLSRQTLTLIEDEEGDLHGDDAGSTNTSHDAFATYELGSIEDETLNSQSIHSAIRWVGFNGRCNKVADTCYTWWNVAALDVGKSRCKRFSI